MHRESIAAEIDPTIRFIATTVLVNAAGYLCASFQYIGNNEPFLFVAFSDGGP
ncbi:hypothetical protein Rcae01_02559 [Novipirellula caenicola]|uniref:Uncharacterized protein n=1 Tax=Novipirellula caenicola TaxID=1536901 RepID=A0ABP9VPJ8_9BACT